MCSGRIDPFIVTKAFENGFDGVAVLGCHLGDCHYLSGNYDAQIKIQTLMKILKLVNLDDRLMLEWVSAAEGLRFSQVVKDFTDKIRNLGPSPLKNGDPVLLEKFKAVQRVAEDFRIRTLIGRKRPLIEDGNVYGEKVIEEEFDNFTDDAIMAEFKRNRIFLQLKEPKSVKEVAKNIDLDSQEVLRHVVVLRQRGLVAVDRIDNVTPYYVSIEV
jgi:coenzyme F420-reducing hydrogenase delta subunit